MLTAPYFDSILNFTAKYDNFKSFMARNLIKEARKAITAEVKLQSYYRQMSQKAANPKVKAVLHDLLLMEEINEMLLHSLNQRMGL